MAQDNDPPNVRYRRLADECLAAVGGVVHSEIRITLAAMAQSWRRLAEHYESRLVEHCEERPAHPRPVGQQQQQIQPKDPERDDK
jgi:hypothetical protein